MPPRDRPSCFALGHVTERPSRDRAEPFPQSFVTDNKKDLLFQQVFLLIATQCQQRQLFFTLIHQETNLYQTTKNQVLMVEVFHSFQEEGDES